MVDLKSAVKSEMQQLEQSLVNGLSFVPAEKRSWKPAPTAHSAQEIFGHAVGALSFVQALIKGKAAERPSAEQQAQYLKQFEKLEQAKAVARDNFQSFVKTVDGLSEKDLQQEVSAPFGGKIPCSQLIVLAARHTAYHLGQLCYLQTILGDTEDHLR